MSKITFFKKSHKPGFTVSNFKENESSIYKPSFSSLNRKQRRFIERKMKEV